MCRTIHEDGSVALPTGASHATRHRNLVRVQFLRYNYVVYEGLGANLDDSFLGFLSGLTTPASSRDFFYIEPDSPNNLNALFNVGSRRQIYPRHYQEFTSPLTNKWIYFFIDVGPGTLIELNYESYQSWAAGVFETGDQGAEWVEIDSFSSDVNDLFRLNRRVLENTYAIALPSRVNPETAVNILLGRPGGSNVGETREFCRLIPVALPEGARGVDMRFLIFDPGHLIDHTVEVIEAHTRLMRIVDARNRFRRLSRWERRTRNKGILACLMKQLVEADSSLTNEVHQRALTRSFNRYANYGFRKAYFIDNIYNFLRHPIMERLEECLMEHRVNNQLIDGGVWLKMISPLAEIAGEHTLLTNYFLSAAEYHPDDSAWATFFKSSLETGTARENSTVAAWKDLMSLSDYASLAVGLSEAITYKLVRDYTDGSINWNQFESLLRSKKDRIERLARSIGRSRRMTNHLKKMGSAFKWGKRLGKVAAALKGDISASTLKTSLSVIADSADARKAAALAAKISFVVNAIDIVGNAADVRDRFENEDYDAAASYGVAVAAGVTEMAFIYAYGASAASTGPVGIVLAIIGAMAAIIASLTTDSELERFARHSVWGVEAHQSRSRASWSATRFSDWTDDDIGVEFQLTALMNLLHKYEVNYNYDDDTHVISIEIVTKFLPDSAIFVFHGEFVNSRGSTANFIINIRQPSRNSRNRSNLYASRGGRTVVQTGRSSCGTARIESDDGVHTIKVRIRANSNVRSGKGYIVCQPFGHADFKVPDGGRGFFLDDITNDRWFSADLEFKPDSFKNIPG